MDYEQVADTVNNYGQRQVGMSETTILSLAVLALPTLIVIALPKLGVLLPSVVFWSAGSYVLLATTEGLGWILVILWLAAGIPLGILYCSLVKIIRSVIVAAYRNYY